MTGFTFSLLRGVCQIPAYVAHRRGFFAERGLEATLDVAPTAWLIPEKLARRDSQFAVMPWTRVAAAEEEGLGLVVVAGSGFEEAAIVLRSGRSIDDVKRVAVPQRGGMKDLTAMGLLADLGWEDVTHLRQPGGDGAIISLFGQGSDAASMIEPFATMFEVLGAGQVVRRTGDLWPGAPGCCLTTTHAIAEAEPELVQAVVDAFVAGARFVHEEPDAAAAIAHEYIGISPEIIRKALDRNRPDVDGIRNDEAMGRILEKMRELGYLERAPSRFRDLRFLDRATAPGV